MRLRASAAPIIALSYAAFHVSLALAIRPAARLTTPLHPLIRQHLIGTGMSGFDEAEMAVAIDEIAKLYLGNNHVST